MVSACPHVDGGADSLVRYSGIGDEGYRSLEDGHRAEFEVTHGRKGLQAVGVRVIG